MGSLQSLRRDLLLKTRALSSASTIVPATKQTTEPSDPADTTDTTGANMDNRRGSKRLRTRAQQQQDEQHDAMDGSAEADATTPAKRQRLHEERQKQHTPSLSGRTATAPTTLPKSLTLECMKSTRAILGHGFHVRQLLDSDDECTTIRVSVLATPAQAAFLHDNLTRRLKHAVKAIEHIPTGAPDSANAASAAKHHIWLLRMTNDPDGAAPFHKIRSLCAFLDKKPVAKGPDTQSLRATSPITSPFTRRRFSGMVSVAWPAGQLTGHARLTFSTASAANAFNKCALQYELPILIESIELLGLIEETDAKSQDDKKKNSRWKNLLPPLKGMTVNSTAQWYFDEEKIAEMTAVETASFRYIVLISTLPFRLQDEEWLARKLRPHICTVALERQSDRAFRGHSVARDLSKLLRANLPNGEAVVLSRDNWTLRERADVPCMNVGPLHDMTRRAKRCCAKVSAALPETLSMQLPISVVTTFEYRTSLALHKYLALQHSIAEARLYAREQGVVWWEEGELRHSNNRGMLWTTDAYSPHVTIRLRSSSLSALKRVEAVLDAFVDSDHLSSLAFEQQRQRDSLLGGWVQKMKAGALALWHGE